MTSSDIGAGMRLKERAGWNQLEADWRRLVALQPDGCFAAEWEGAIVGTVTTSRFGPVGWVAMMLVDEAFRGRGIGRALMVRAVEDLEAHGVTSIRLDATPLGRPLYESLGFAEESVFVRFEGRFRPRGGGAPGADVQAMRDVAAIVDLDRAVTGTDRLRLLQRLSDDQPGYLRVVTTAGSIEGYAMSRPGSRAWQVGPCIADDRSGLLLLADAAYRLAGEPVFLDIPATHNAARGAAAALGLSPGRQLTRMGRGPRVVEDLTRLWTSAGPEKG